MINKGIENKVRNGMEFGFQEFNKSKFNLEGNPIFIQNGLIKEETHFEEIFNCIREKKSFYLLAGINPYVKYHLGYKFLSQVINYFLSNEHSKGYIIMPKREISLMGRNEDNNEETESFMNLIKNKEKLNLRDDSFEGLDELIFYMSKRYSIQKMKKAFKLEEKDKVSKYLGIFYAIANYFIPNIENKTNFPTLVLANKKHRNLIMYANNLSNDLNLQKISSIILKDVPGKDGSFKMSASNKKSLIYLDSIKEVFPKTITSGGWTETEQLEKGGNPERCPALNIGKFFNGQNTILELGEDCKKGKNCSTCKEKVLRGILKK
jgi:tryptophanyl-tRNA synthetase